MSRKGSTARHDRSDQDILNLFTLKAQELSETNLAKKGFRIEYNVQYHHETGIHRELIEPDEDEFRSFLLTFRLFISEQEPVFLNRIFSICHKCLNDDEIRNNLKEARKSWMKIQQHSGFHIIINGKEHTAAEVCDMWINGKYFHNDFQPQEKLRQASLDEFLAYRLHFLFFIEDATRHIAYLYNVVLKALEDDLLIFNK